MSKPTFPRDNYYDTSFCQPRIWVGKGWNLIFAYQALVAAEDPKFHPNDIRDQALMLAGMGIETLLKALIIAEPVKRQVVLGVAEPTTSAEVHLQRSFFSHRVQDLAIAAEVPLDDRQVACARALSQFIYWRGRYVVPSEKALHELDPIPDAQGVKRAQSAAATYDATDSIIGAVVDRVNARLYPPKR